jgi:hypothetical protein
VRLAVAPVKERGAADFHPLERLDFFGLSFLAAL